MIRVHHLNNSRSQRILWLLEEYGSAYEIVHHQRDTQTNLAPPDLTAVHPLGKSPVVELDGRAMIESGAIIDILSRRVGDGRLRAPADSAEEAAMIEWLHYAEGSAMLPLMLRLYTSRLGDAAAPLMPRIDSETANHLSYVEAALGSGDWLLGDFSIADIQMSFVGEIAGVFGLRGGYPAMDAWVRRFQARPAYARALAKGGPYSFA